MRKAIKNALLFVSVVTACAVAGYTLSTCTMWVLIAR